MYEPAQSARRENTNGAIAVEITITDVIRPRHVPRVSLPIQRASNAPSLAAIVAAADPNAMPNPTAPTAEFTKVSESTAIINVNMLKGTTMRLGTRSTSLPTTRATSADATLCGRKLVAAAAAERPRSPSTAIWWNARAVETNPVVAYLSERDDEKSVATQMAGFICCFRPIDDLLLVSMRMFKS